MMALRRFARTSLDRPAHHNGYAATARGRMGAVAS